MADSEVPIKYMDRTRHYYRALGYAQDYVWAAFDDVPFSQPTKPLSPEILSRVREDRADAAVLCPLCPVCHQTVSLVARHLGQQAMAKADTRRTCGPQRISRLHGLAEIAVNQGRAEQKRLAGK